MSRPPTNAARDVPPSGSGAGARTETSGALGRGYAPRRAGQPDARAPGPHPALRIVHLLGERRLNRDPARGATSGLVRAVLELAAAQAALGHHVTVASVGESRWEARWRGVRLVSLVPWRAFRFTLNGRTIDLRGIMPFVWLTRTQPFEVVHGHYHNYMRFLGGDLHVAHFHGDPFHPGHSSRSLAFDSRDFAMVARYSRVQIGISSFVREQLQQGLGAAGNLRTVYNGIDRVRFTSEGREGARAKLRAEWGAREGDTVFLYAGAIATEKGIHHLLNAFRSLGGEHPDARLVIVGSGDLWRLSTSEGTELQEYAARVIQTVAQGDEGTSRLKLLGSQPSEAMPDVYCAADVVVVPSVVAEGFGLVAGEALSCDKPVIASRVGGLPELVSEANGLLVEAGDEQALAEAMRTLLVDRALRARLATAARASTARFTWQRTAEEVLAIYHEHLGRGGGDERATSTARTSSMPR